MTTNKAKDNYRPTEAKYKGGASEMFVTYDLEQKTRGGGHVTYPKVKRVYIAGDVKDWKVGTVQKKSGRQVHGVRIEYEQSRKRHQRRGFSAERDSTRYKVAPTSVGATGQKFAQVVEIPTDARNVHFYKGSARLPEKYRHALQRVR
jgi:hypothetical protein